MKRINAFLKDNRGTSFEGIALSVSIVAVAFVASADMLDYATKSSDQPSVAQMRSTAPMMASGNLDETPTASLPTMASRTVLDPCTGRVK